MGEGPGRWRILTSAGRIAAGSPVQTIYRRLKPISTETGLVLPGEGSEVTAAISQQQDQRDRHADQPEDARTHDGLLRFPRRKRRSAQAEVPSVVFDQAALARFWQQQRGDPGHRDDQRDVAVE